jgi:hypothetical protein
LVSGVGIATTIAANSTTSTTSIIITSSSYIRTTITGTTITYKIIGLEEDVVRGPSDSITTDSITTSVPLVVAFPEKNRKNVLHGWHYAGFIISALMTAAGFISNSMSAFMSGLGILIITITSIYELRKK